MFVEQPPGFAWVSEQPPGFAWVSEHFKVAIAAGFRQHGIHIPCLVKNIRCGVVPVPLLVKMSICMV